MIEHELMDARGVLVVRPMGPLSSDDFVSLAAIVDPYVEMHGELKGLMIEIDEFPGWEDFDSLVSHFRFVRDHHRKVGRVAVVSDSNLVARLPSIANHFVSAELRSFKRDERSEALAWLSNAPIV